MRITRDTCGCLYDADAGAWITDCPTHRFSQDMLERMRIEIILKQIAEQRSRSSHLFEPRRGNEREEKIHRDTPGRRAPPAHPQATLFGPRHPIGRR